MTDEDGTPLVKTHGFGITMHRLLVRYPFTTCDSTTWSLSAGYGKIFIPEYVNGRADYYRPPLGVIVSGQPQATENNEAKQYARLGPLKRAHVQCFLKECGLTISEARYDDGARRKAIIHYYQQFEKHFETTKIIFAHISTAREFSQILTDAGAFNRLLSYHDLRHRPGFIEYHVMTGLNPPTKPIRRKRQTWGDQGYAKRRVCTKCRNWCANSRKPF